MAALAVLTLTVAPPAATATRWQWPIPAPPYYQVHVGECPASADFPGCAVTDPTDPAFGDVWWADGDPFTLEFELGHVFAAELLTEGDRRYFARLLGLPGPWKVGDPARPRTLTRSPSERFAEAYAFCRLRTQPGSDDWWITYYEYRPTRRQHRRICSAIARVAWRAGIYAQ